MSIRKQKAKAPTRRASASTHSAIKSGGRKQKADRRRAEGVDYQKTLEKQVVLEGVGVHTGSKCRMVIRPARSDTGIRFCRTDLPGKPVIPATVDYVRVSEMMRCTVLGTKDGVQIATPEHVLAAFGGLGVDNVLIELNASECPILDGSSKVIVDSLKKAGIKRLRKPRRYFKLRKPLHSRFEDVMITALPSRQLILTYFMDYDPPYHLSQQIQLTITPEIFESDVGPARTYVFYPDVEKLKKQGLIKGGNINNALVLDEMGRPMNRQRFTDEGVRHKILDLLGDLVLLGRPIKAHIIAGRSGHASHIEFVKRLQEEMMND